MLWAYQEPAPVYVGKGICQGGIGIGIRVYEGNGDNAGTVQERTTRCAAACSSKRPPLEFGPWSSRGDAVGFGLTENNGRCYCNHAKFASCGANPASPYKSYEFTFNSGTLPRSRTFSGVLNPQLLAFCRSN